MRDLGEIGFNRNQDQILNYKFFSFPAAEKKQNAAAAPDAIQVSAMAWPLRTAPAEAEKG